MTDIQSSRPTTDRILLSEATEEVEALAAYRSVSLGAIVALVVGLASPLALTAPLLRTVPVVGVVLAVWAWVRIDRSDGRTVGRSIALTGLAVSIASLSAGLVREQLTERLLASGARPVAEQWLGHLLAGEARQAFDRTADAGRPAAPPDPMGGPPQPSAWEAFQDQTAVQRLLAVGSGGQVRYEGTAGTQRLNHGRFRVFQQFSVVADSADEADDADATIQLQLTLERIVGRGSTDARWTVADFAEDRD